MSRKKTPRADTTPKDRGGSREIEREAYLSGHPLAFSLSDCAICEQCAGRRGEECVNPKKTRPAFHSIGTNVFKTVHAFGLPLKTLGDPHEEQNWHSAAFVE